jgi:hypothetical protein
MNCQHISENLIDYIEGVIDSELAEKIKIHLENCESCNKEYHQTRELFSTIHKTVNQKPGIELNNSFFRMLEEEKRLQKQQPFAFQDIFKKHKIYWQAAAAVLLLITGFLAGYGFKGQRTENQQSDQLTKMQQDVGELKQIMALNLLKDGSASERIKAVNYTEEIPLPGEDVIDALITTLNQDNNSNVRLASIYSLARFKNVPKVKNAFLQTLNQQEDPMIQIVIINILVETEDVRAVNELNKLLEQKELNQDVKEHAEKSLKILI